MKTAIRRRAPARPPNTKPRDAGRRLGADADHHPKPGKTTDVTNLHSFNTVGKTAPALTEAPPVSRTRRSGSRPPRDGDASARAFFEAASWLAVLFDSKPLALRVVTAQAVRALHGDGKRYAQELLSTLRSAYETSAESAAYGGTLTMCTENMGSEANNAADVAKFVYCAARELKRCERATRRADRAKAEAAAKGGAQ
jgi:hypothetical protein